MTGTWDLGDIDSIVRRERIRARLPRRRGRVLTPSLHFGITREHGHQPESGDIILARIKLKLAKPEPPKPDVYSPPIAPELPPILKGPPPLLTTEQQALRVATYIVAEAVLDQHRKDDTITMAVFEGLLHAQQMATLKIAKTRIPAAIAWVQSALAQGYAVMPNSGGAWTLRNYAAINPHYELNYLRLILAERGYILPEAP